MIHKNLDSPIEIQPNNTIFFVFDIQTLLMGIGLTRFFSEQFKLNLVNIIEYKQVFIARIDNKKSQIDNNDRIVISVS